MWIIFIYFFLMLVVSEGRFKLEEAGWLIDVDRNRLDAPGYTEHVSNDEMAHHREVLNGSVRRLAHVRATVMLGLQQLPYELRVLVARAIKAPPFRSQPTSRRLTVQCRDCKRLTFGRDECLTCRGALCGSCFTKTSFPIRYRCGSCRWRDQ